MPARCPFLGRLAGRCPSPQAWPGSVAGPVGVPAAGAVLVQAVSWLFRAVQPWPAPRREEEGEGTDGSGSAGRQWPFAELTGHQLNLHFHLPADGSSAGANVAHWVCSPLLASHAQPEATVVKTIVALSTAA